MRFRFVFLSLVALAASCALAQEKHDAPSAHQSIEVTDDQGTQHVVSDCIDNGNLQGCGTPFDQGVGIDNVPAQINTLIAVSLHPSVLQKDGSGHGYYRAMLGGEPEAMILIPLSAIDDITFTTKKNIGEVIMIQSNVRLAGGEPFEAGESYGRLVGKEDLGALGTADFVTRTDRVKEIKSRKPTPFVGDFGFFGATAAPFKVKITDTSGTDLVLEKALCCGSQLVVKGRTDGYQGTTGWQHLTYTSEVNFTKGEATYLSIEAAKLSKIKIGKNTDNPRSTRLAANVTLQSGEVFDLTVTSSGIIGSSAKGWLWIPLSRISNLEFVPK